MPVPTRDIEIRIFRSEQPDGTCRVSITGTDDRRADGLFSSPFSKSEIDRALAWMDLGTPLGAPSRSDVRDFGKRLFGALFRGAVAGVYVASQDANSPARIRLTVDDPAASRIPWELLVDPATDEALSLRARFVRGIATEGGARRLAVDPPLRVLVVDSAPRDQPRLDSQLEARDIAGALAGVVAQGRVEVTTLEHATLGRVLDRLREGATDHPPRPFHVLHWIGHGRIDAVTGANELLFETDEGDTDPVDGARLANVLAGSDVRLVLLNACHSAAPSPTDPAAPAAPTSPASLTSPVAPAAETTRAIAEVLLTAGIPAVVGMRVAVMDETARRFAREFYAALADGRGVDDAVLDARILVTGHEPDASAEVGVPVAYLRSGSGQLLTSVRPLAWWQVPLVRFRRLRPVARVAVFVLAVIAALAVERSVEAIVNELQGPPPMMSELNVVVTAFEASDPSARPGAVNVVRDLAGAFAETLAEELRASTGLRAEVRHPDVAGRLAGSTAEERAVAASALADRINADVVVYGSLDSSGTTLQPEYYVREGLLADAEELYGSSRLGSPIIAVLPIDGEPSAQGMVRRELVARARALSEMIAGLSFFRLGDYANADRHFDTAMNLPGLDDSEGKEVVYLFRGSAAGASRRLDEAERWFREALTLNPGFVRARLGLAEVEFQRGKGKCEPGEVDHAALRRAAAEYDRAISTTDDPEAVSISARARLGKARVYICISNAEIENLWSDAAAEASNVIAAFEAGDRPLQQLAAEAHAVRGLARLPPRCHPDPGPHYENAAEDVRRAIELALQADRKAAYYVVLADILHQLGRLDEAKAQYDYAIRLEPDASDDARYQAARDALDAPSTPTPSAAPESCRP